MGWLIHWCSQPKIARFCRLACAKPKKNVNLWLNRMPMNDTITARNYKKLALQVGVHGLSFCAADMLSGHITGFGTAAFSRYIPLEDELWKAFVNNPALTRPYDEIVVLHDNSFCTFVPDALFDPTLPGSYLQYNTKVFETDAFATDALPGHGMHNVHVPMMNVNNFLIDQFGGFDYKNANSVLVARLLDASRNIDDKQVFVHVQDTHFEIVVVRNQQLLLYNSFEYSTPQDFLYYLLFTLEQLFLNPETVKVTLLGGIEEAHECFILAYTYIRNVALMDTAAPAEKWSTTEQEARQHFILFNA